MTIPEHVCVKWITEHTCAKWMTEYTCAQWITEHACAKWIKNMYVQNGTSEVSQQGSVGNLKPNTRLTTWKTIGDQGQLCFAPGH